jgi:aldose 1-epimerase
MWKMDADSLPTDLVTIPPEADYSQLRPASNWTVDNCFTGWSRRAVLDYPTHRMQIDASEACRQIVVFAPNDGRNFIALEPVTNINNAFALAAKGVAETGVRMLASGESFEMSMTISVGGRVSSPPTAPKSNA